MNRPADRVDDTADAAHAPGPVADPMMLFQEWYGAQRHLLVDDTSASACCLSTVGLDGYPAARFVALKTVDDQAFVVTGPLESRKALELQSCPRASLTFWWPHAQRQVRVQGDAEPLPADLADHHFRQRPRPAQLRAWASRQGQPLPDAIAVQERLRQVADHFAGRSVPRPNSWGSHRIVPIRIEFLEFDTQRLHERLLFTREGGGWARQAGA